MSKNTTGGTKNKDDISTKEKKLNTLKHALLTPQRKVLEHGNRKISIIKHGEKANTRWHKGFFASVITEKFNTI